MRYACIGLLLLLATPGIRAQYDRFTNPCGFTPADSVDVTGDGLPDIVITGYRVGTDDEPSSGGNCTLYVIPLTGTLLLSDRRTPRECQARSLAPGDTIVFIPRQPENDHHWQRKAFIACSIPVLQWGYGSHTNAGAKTQDHTTMYFGSLHTTGDHTVIGSFAVLADPKEKRIRVLPGGTGPVDGVWIVR